MSLRRQPPCVELKDGKPEVNVEKLHASKSIHYTWVVDITNILQSRNLWEDVAADVNPVLLHAAAIAHAAWCHAEQEQQHDDLLQATMSDDTLTEMKNAKGEETMETTLQHSIHRGRAPPPLRTPRRRFVEADLALEKEHGVEGSTQDLDRIIKNFKIKGLALSLLRSTIDQSLGLEDNRRDGGGEPLIDVKPTYAAHFGRPFAVKDKEAKKGDEKSKRFEGKCFNCDKKGHRADDCRRPKDAVNVATPVDTSRAQAPKSKKKVDKRIGVTTCNMLCTNVSWKNQCLQQANNMLQQMPGGTTLTTSPTAVQKDHVPFVSDETSLPHCGEDPVRLEHHIDVMDTDLENVPF